MSANSLDRVSSSSKQPNADDHSSSDEQPKEKKVCFVCGSRTIFIVNIRERRCGPNMIDVISEKFKMRPLSDDKFLCYSCNNWLINWYSMQKKEDTSSQDDDLQQTTSSTVIAAAEPAKTSGARRAECSTDDDLILISDSEENDANNSDNENVDVNNIVETLRHRLRKYLYRPRSKNSTEYFSHEWHNMRQPEDSATHFMEPLSSHEPPDTVFASVFERQRCERCNKSITVHRHRGMHPKKSQKIKQFCQKCRYSMGMSKRISNRQCIARNIVNRHRIMRSSHRYEIGRQRRRQLRQKSKPYLPPTESRSNEQRTSNNCTNIVDKLKQLGTSIHRESDSDDQPQAKRQRRHDHVEVMTSIPFDIDMLNNTTENAPLNHERAEGPSAVQNRVTRNQSNEILLTFNTVLTEVFPIELLYNFSNCGSHNESSEVPSDGGNATNGRDHIKNFNEILKNVPKSLTITLT